MVKPAYLVFGTERSVRERVLAEMRSTYCPGEAGSLDYTVFFAETSRVRDVIDCAHTLPFAGAYRLIVVRGVEHFSPDERSSLVAYVKKPAPHTCLVLETGDEKVFKELYGIDARVEVMRCDTMNDAGIYDALRPILASYGKKIQRDAVLQLIEIAGQQLDLIVSEVEKAAVFTGSRSVITREDVEALAGRGVEHSVFDLTDAIGMKRSALANRIMSDLIASGKRPGEIIGALAWHLRRLLRAREMTHRGLGQELVASRLKIGRRFREAFFAQMKKFTSDELSQKLEVLLMTDRDIKKSRQEPMAALTVACLNLCL